MYISLAEVGTIKAVCMHVTSYICMFNLRILGIATCTALQSYLCVVMFV